ncbi:MAG: COQ9 family protein [Acidisphaera sp.]|nr:COQ9 family protein [Acidisphaera sp.]
MIEPPERSPARDAAIEAALPLVPRLGWNLATVGAALAGSGADGRDAAVLFPGGTGDLLEAFCDLADRRMEAEAAGMDLAARKLPARVRALIALRLAQQRPHKTAISRAVALLALPRHASLAARCTARTVDAIWHAAGDRSADFSWYTKRAILAGVYTSTVLFWLSDSGDADGEGDTATLAFLDRRLADVGRIGRLRRRVSACLPGQRETPQTSAPAPPA